MIIGDRQAQRAGDNSQLMQAGIVNVYNGIDEKRAREICAETFEIAKLLLESGADADAKDSMGMSAREYAVLFKNQEMIELMKKYPPAEKNCNE